MSILSSFFQESKNIIYFPVAKMRLKSDVITLTCSFFAIAQEKIKILLRNCACVLFVWITIIYTPFFLDIMKIVNFVGNYFGKFEILSIGEKTGKNIKNTGQSSCRAFNSAPFGFFRLRRTSKLNILAALKHLPIFTQNGQTGRH